MRRDELLQHLNAICDAENAANASRQAIDTLTGKMNSRRFYEEA